MAVTVDGGLPLGVTAKDIALASSPVLASTAAAGMSSEYPGVDDSRVVDGRGG